MIVHGVKEEKKKYIFYDIETTGLNPIVNKVIGFAWADNNGRCDGVVSDDENYILKKIVEVFYDSDGATFVGFNNRRFDDNFVIVRMIKNGFSEENIRLFKRQKRVDLMNVVMRIICSSRFIGLSKSCELFGVEHDGKDTGRDVINYYIKGEYEKIYQHNIDDVRATRRLFNKLIESGYGVMMNDW